MGFIGLPLQFILQFLSLFLSHRINAAEAGAVLEVGGRLDSARQVKPLPEAPSPPQTVWPVSATGSLRLKRPFGV
jgi:hypothetical protein